MHQVSIHEARTHLSRLVKKAVNGEPFVIARAGKAHGDGKRLKDRME